MSLTICNVGESGDEDFDFWEIPCPADHFAGLEVAESDELELLCQDYHRCQRQNSQLRKIAPAKAEFYQGQCDIAVDLIEKKIKKLLSNRIAYQSSIKTAVILTK